MLPAVLVTLATFLLELCSSSPIYNMQPAFITNTLGATTGRNIRNLPCISRRNNNQHGVCMFAIDCVKANGTHLGTCIDRFYFGSCCHIEPVHDIIENTIDTDIIPAREPPYRISSTTSTTVSSTKLDEEESLISIFNKLDLQSSTSPLHSTTDKTVATTLKLDPLENSTRAPIVNESKIQQNTSTTATVFGEKISTSESINITEVTTIPQKLQTFQVVDGSTLEDVTTKASVTTIKPTKLPTKSPTSKPVTQSPKPTKPTTSKPPTTKPTDKSTVRPTTKPKPTRAPSTTKPTKTSKPTASKPTPKPSKVTTKPVRITTTRKPTIQTTKAPSTAKPSKKPTTTTPKPTKKVTTTESTTKLTTVTPKLTTTTFKPITKVTATTKQPVVLTTTTVSNEIPVNAVNSSQTLETVSGNPVTNEIEAAKPVSLANATKPTSKPEVASWTVADDKNYTAPSTEVTLNVTTEDWIPITTPDGWILLPSVSTTVSPQTSDITPSSSNQSSSVPSEKPLSSTIMTTASPALVEGEPSVTSTTTEMTTPVINNVTGTPSEKPSGEVTSLTTTSPVDSTSESTADLSDRPVNMSDFTDVCGRRMFPEARIVGGEKSSFGKWPWQISLRQWRTSTYLHKCGAALLNENWAITAAHCVDNVPPSDLLLRLGEHDLSTEGEPYLHQERRVQIVASHPQFDPRTFEYDLALLRFYEPVTFQPNILPVCVPQTDENFIGRTAYVTGWGRLYEDGPLPSILQEVSVPVINNTVCEGMYRAAGYIEHIPHIFICAGWRRGGFDSCEGDSGGPMVIQREDKRFLLAGVISWGIGCAEPNQPGVYTRISEFRDWINQILQF